MKVSTQTYTFGHRYGEHEGIRRLARIGYDAVDYTIFEMGDSRHPLFKDDFREYALSIRKTCDENNIVINQTHAPFPSYVEGNEQYNKDIVPLIIKAIEVTSIVGGKIVVVHPAKVKENQKEMNMAFFNKLLPYAKKFGVKIAVENMWGWDEESKKVTPSVCSTPEEFVDYLDSIDKDWFVACLDIGHGEMQGTGSTSVELIRALGHDRLKSLHVHDNNKIFDLHALPFTQSINWHEIFTALKEINYGGEFTYECDGGFLDKFPDELLEKASKFMLDIGKYFGEKYNL